MADYTDIQQELDDFENAVYGEEVRSSMVSAIKKIHDVAESAAGAPNASSATAGQAPIANGAGGWQWGDVATSGDSVPTEVRQAIATLFSKGVYTETGLADEVAIIQSWATEITAISVSPTTLQINGMSQETIVATTTPAGGTVTWSSSDESIATVSGGVVTPTGINGQCTITATCGGKSATCAVTVSGFATLESISAVYSGGTVYTTDTLESLKNNLTVTAHWSDSRTTTVTDYTLSGTIAEGTNTITVSYQGKTDTFTVTGVRYQEFDYIYNSSTATTGTQYEYVDTGLYHTPAWTTLNIEFEAMNGNATSGSDAVMGSNGSSNTDTGSFIWLSRTSKAGFSTYTLGIATVLNTDGDTRKVVKYVFVDGGQSYVELDGTQTNVATVSASSITANGKSLILAGGRQYQSANTAYGLKGGGMTKVGYIKFTDPNTNTLLYHFVPAHDLEENQYGFYEKVNNVFYPSNGTYYRCGNWED